MRSFVENGEVLGWTPSISTMVVLKRSDDLEGKRVKLYGLLCGELYKEDDGFIVTGSVTDPDSNTNFFTWPRKDYDWVVSGD